MYKFLSNWPTFSQTPEDIDRLDPTLPISLDLEWDQSGSPTILGLSDGKLHISVEFFYGFPYFREMLEKYPELEIAGHNVISADIMVLEKMGIAIPLEHVTDSIILHWLVNPNLCKSSGKAALSEDEGDIRGRGFMNLGSFASIYTDLPHWKTCRGAVCEGPCPEHSRFHYNALDSASVAMALPVLKRQAKLRGVSKLYPMHRQLAYDLAQIQEAGVRIDIPFVYSRDKHPLGSTDGQSLDEKFRKAKDEIEITLPFNPRSPKAVSSYFSEKLDIKLPDVQEKTIADLVEELGDAAPAELVSLLNFKELGNGCDRWFEVQHRDKNGWNQGYLDINGYIHPRTAFFTSSGRLMQSSPNLQNISKRRKLKTGENIGKLVRRAIIAPEDHYIVRADLSNAEGRTVLYYGGYLDVPNDVHSWMVENIGLKEDEPFSKALGSARDAAKSVTHASNYMEGLQLKTIAELKTPKMKKEIDFGARIVFWNWSFKGYIVTFTGGNLAHRVLGSRSLENRRWALDVMTRYIDKSFPGIRDFQKRVSKQLETERCVRTPLGYVKPSYDANPNEELKTAVSIWGSQPTAHLNKLAVIDIQEKYRKGRKMRAFHPMHDEVLTYVHKSITPAEAMRWIKESMEIALPEMAGLIIPADPSFGPNWADQSNKI